jgi:hypothetical protein
MWKVIKHEPAYQPCVVQGVSPVHLYEYLLSHNRQYGMDVIRMDPFIQDDRAEKEHILVQLSPHKVVYRNHQESI